MQIRRRKKQKRRRNCVQMSEEPFDEPVMHGTNSVNEWLVQVGVPVAGATKRPSFRKSFRTTNGPSDSAWKRKRLPAS